MTHSPAPAWHSVFLRELARTGSVAAAAERAGIDRSSAYQLRRRNSAFALGWDRAQGAARDRLEGAVQGRDAVPRRKLHLRGDEVVRRSKDGRPCIARVGPGRWSRAGEEAFLTTLCATANVRAAAAAAGVSTVAAYARRRLWPAFAAAWDEAKGEGYLRLELMLIQAATATIDPPEVPTGHEPPPMSYDQALNLLRLRQGAEGARGGRGRGYAWRTQEPDIEQVRAEVMRKLAALERARGGAG